MGLLIYCITVTYCISKAKEFGDILIVSITSDRYVNKGPNRPFYNQIQRLNQISFIETVDYVC